MNVDVFKTNFAGTARKELVGPSVDEVKWTLNGPGGAKISADPLDPNAALILLNEVELQIWMNGVYKQCVIPRSVNGSLEKVTFTTEGLLSEFQDAYMADTFGAVPANSPLLHWTGQEQFNIIVGMIEWAQARANSDLRIDTGAFTASGIFRTRTFYDDAFENLYDAMQAFAELNEGFDFDIQLFGDGRREFWPYYPNKGSYKPQYGLELDQRGRKYVQAIESWERTALNQGTEFYVTGGSLTQDNPDPTPDTQLKVVGHYEDTAAGGSPKYRRRTRVISSSQITDVGWLNDRAELEELLRGDPITTASLSVSETLFGLIDTGDTVPVNVDFGVIQMKGSWRIMEITWRKDKQDLLLSLQPA